MAEHSPLPWNRFDHPVGSIMVRGADKADVCIMLGMNPDLPAPPNRVTKVAGPDADFIVRAVNSFDDLVDACEVAIETIQSWHGNEAWEIYFEESPEMKTIRGALDKAGVTDAG